MPIPSDITPVTVTGTFPVIDGEPQDGYVVFDPGGPVKDSNGHVIFEGAATAPVRASVMKPTGLVPTDAAGITPFLYTITVRVGSETETYTGCALPSSLAPSTTLDVILNPATAPTETAYTSANTWAAPQTFAGSPPMIVPGGTAGEVLTLDSTGHVTAQPPAGVTFTHPFTTAASVTVTHNLGKFPSVTVVDSAMDEVEGDVQYLTGNSLTVSFSAPFSGTVYCN